MKIFALIAAASAMKLNQRHSHRNNLAKVFSLQGPTGEQVVGYCDTDSDQKLTHDELFNCMMGHVPPEHQAEAKREFDQHWNEAVRMGFVKNGKVDAAGFDAATAHFDSQNGGSQSLAQAGNSTNSTDGHGHHEHVQPELTPEMVMSHCDKNGDSHLNKKEAHHCVDEYVKYMLQEQVSQIA